MTMSEIAVKSAATAASKGNLSEDWLAVVIGAEGVKYQPGWILATTATVKVFIDVFIGIWAFILGYIWTNHIDRRADKARPSEIWERFPKFIIGFVVVFDVACARHHARHRQGVALCRRRGERVPGDLLHPDVLLHRRFVGFPETVAGRLWQACRGYVVSLFGFVIWVGLMISWLFFAGFTPPLAG